MRKYLIGLLLLLAAVTAVPANSLAATHRSHAATHSRKHSRRHARRHHRRHHRRRHAKRIAVAASKKAKKKAAANSADMPVVSAVGAPRITGTTYYVSATGSDSNSGTSPAQAWRTVGRVNDQVLKPGDGVLFEGGQTFSDSDLEPASSGTAAQPIVFGSYGAGNAVITHGGWFVHDHLIFDHLTFNATLFGGSETQGTSNDITVQNCDFSLPAGNQQLGLYTNGNDWTIQNNLIQNTGLSGMLLNGDTYTITANTINNVGLYNAGYNAHGIYLDASNATITDNTITNFSESAVSVRYRNSTIERNYMSGGQIGIDFYQTDPTAGTSNWHNNTIANTTAAGIYTSDDGVYPLQESFVIQDNSIAPSSGVLTNLKPTTGSYTVSSNLKA